MHNNREQESSLNELQKAKDIVTNTTLYYKKKLQTEEHNKGILLKELDLTDNILFLNATQ